MARRGGPLILRAGNGKTRVLFGTAAARERRRLAEEIDRTIGRALRGDLPDTEFEHVEQLARLADRLARGGA
jgi:hypothetical protein